MADVRLTLFAILVQFIGGSTAIARTEGNNAAWQCACGDSVALLGRCCFQFDHNCTQFVQPAIEGIALSAMPTSAQTMSKSFSQ